MEKMANRPMTINSSKIIYHHLIIVYSHTLLLYLNNKKEEVLPHLLYPKKDWGNYITIIGLVGNIDWMIADIENSYYL